MYGKLIYLSFILSGSYRIWECYSTAILLSCWLCNTKDFLCRYVDSDSSLHVRNPLDIWCEVLSDPISDTESHFWFCWYVHCKLLSQFFQLNNNLLESTKSVLIEYFFNDMIMFQNLKKFCLVILFITHKFDRQTIQILYV